METDAKGDGAPGAILDDDTIDAVAAQRHLISFMRAAMKQLGIRSECLEIVHDDRYWPLAYAAYLLGESALQSFGLTIWIEVARSAGSVRSRWNRSPAR